ncbi:dihydrodipicolinate synthase family protein [Futiania mangrovi]|uniref:Dihydrodipicolinate synthase family protein n=1 Tax=Futiania mangrovi TaxID=2959716 RepID=A0A9J6PMI8_9PROT|nr:dihydrodipicolinate synthase family protein [Futiania mangrovii]MCP1337895.1 dihydrodipicolinate synthase family protein [Futiania mangrovii]
MTSQDRFSGVLAPVVTPFGQDLAPDAARLAAHCKWLVSHGVRLAVFGTNSEANSMSVGEKQDLLDRLAGSGVEPADMMPGTGACALSDAVALTAHAVRLGCGGVLMLPPFYYKGVPEDGLYRYYAEVIGRVGADGLRIYLYHIPHLTGVPITLGLIERLVRDFPGTVVGIKDSSGDWANTQAMLDRQWDDFAVFVGSEDFLLQGMRNGAVGCISATANVNPQAIARLAAHWRDADADAAQADLSAVRKIFQQRPMIPAMKYAIAHYGSDPGWTQVRPPLVPLGKADGEGLIADLDTAGFGALAGVTA